MSSKVLRQVVVYLDPASYAKLDDKRKRAPYKPSMSAYAGAALMRLISKAKRKAV